MDPLISVRNLEVIYQKGTPSEIEALKGVNIDVYPEEFLIIFGPSGCGKSTVLYSISGVEEEIENGEIWYKGKDIRTMSKKEFIMYHRNSIGMIFQSHQLIPTLSILNNVTLPLVFEGVPRAERKKRGLEMLEHFGVKEVANKLPGQVSGGQQQRAGIARALINDPDVIVADEPTGNLDSESAINALNTLKDLNRDLKKTIILVTHEGQYLPYADRVIFMKDGQVVDEVKSASNLKNQPVQPGQFDANEKNMHLHAIKTIDFLGFNVISEEYGRMEDALRNYFERKISKEQLFEVLHKPIKKGGIGMYRQKAERLIGDIEEITEVSEIIKGIHADDEKIAHLKIGYVTDWVLQAFHGHLTEAQRQKVKELVSSRIMGKLNHPQFQSQLDESEAKGGAGLNSHTARNIAQKLEVVL